MIVLSWCVDEAVSCGKLWQERVLRVCWADMADTFEFVSHLYLRCSTVTVSPNIIIMCSIYIRIQPKNNILLLYHYVCDHWLCHLFATLITLILLHWLPVNCRLKFKIATLAFKTLQNSQSKCVWQPHFLQQEIKLPNVFKLSGCLDGTVWFKCQPVRAEDREVPGLSPTQDWLTNHDQVTSWINWKVKLHQIWLKNSWLLPEYQILCTLNDWKQCHLLILFFFSSDHTIFF